MPIGKEADDVFLTKIPPRRTMPTPKRERGLSYPKPVVSPDQDRDGAKVTMQTRVAVLDKTPHRFQVIPLREILKLPTQLSSLEHGTGATASPTMTKASKHRSSRSAKISVHLDDPGEGKAIRSLGRSAGRLVLQKKDQNRSSSGSTHKKTASLESTLQHEDAHYTSVPEYEMATIEEFSPTHGYSHSLNQYSFRLKPWKSSNQLTKRNDTGEHNFDIGKETKDADQAGFGGSEATFYTDHSAKDPSAHDLVNTSTTLINSDDQLSPSPRLSDYDPKKRHAIYSHITFPLKRNGFLSDLEQEPGILPFKVDRNPGVTSATPIPAFVGPDSEASEFLSVPTPLGGLVPLTRPLRLTRNSHFPLGGGQKDHLAYSDIVLELLKEVDKDIESWEALHLD